MNILFGLVGMILSAVVSMAPSGGSAASLRHVENANGCNATCAPAACSSGVRSSSSVASRAARPLGLITERLRASLPIL